MDDVRRFTEVQSQLADMWPSMTMRTMDSQQRTIVVVSSMSMWVPPQLTPVFPAYEERYLFLVLSLLRAPRTEVVYVTSQPVLPRLVDYFLELMPRLTADDVRRRLTLISVGDSSARPLTAKILERPRILERLRTLTAGDRHSIILPFNVSPLEVELAIRIGVPVYGADPSLAALGTKTGSRQVFAAAGVASPPGCEGVHSADDVVDAVRDLRAQGNDLREAVLKLDEGVGGFGNATLTIPAGDDRLAIAEAVQRLRPEDPELGAEEFLALLDKQGGIVEERITGAEFASPSVQLRGSPLGQVEVLSTHDQVLGGATGQTFLGCRFPAAPGYSAAVAGLGSRIGAELAARGVIGRFGIDFVVCRESNADWRAYAIEINLRNGGTTHPMLTLQALTDAEYDPDAGRLVAGSRSKHYLATDHLESPAYAALTPDDLLDIATERGLGWDEESMTGVAFHMVSAIAVAGRVGVTAIGDSPDQADQLYGRVRAALDEESQRA
ncbi:MAG: peptide ligase PGM1-related protein [Mycobacteriales bacterium]